MSTLGRRAQEFACEHIARFARGGYLRTEFGDALEEFAQQEAGGQIAWLIEMVNNDAPTPRYWNPSKFKKGWVWDANEATRFCREQDARDFLDGQQMSLGGRPVEHVFLARSTS